MTGFHMAQRVLVKKTEDGTVINALGVVARVCVSHGAAWVALDRRSKNEGVHPFPASDRTRSTHVKAYPEDCELPTDTAKGRRTARRAQTAPVELAAFGRDHWSTFAYLETCWVDNRGEPDRRRMRCDPARHPAYANGQDASAYPTRLKGGALLPNHDDWDCVADLVRVGLLIEDGTATNPRYLLTPDGQRIAALLRAHKANGGSFSDFEAP